MSRRYFGDRYDGEELHDFDKDFFKAGLNLSVKDKFIKQVEPENRVSKFNPHATLPGNRFKAVLTQKNPDGTSEIVSEQIFKTGKVDLKEAMKRLPPSIHEQKKPEVNKKKSWNPFRRSFGYKKSHKKSHKKTQKKTQKKRKSLKRK